MSVLDSVKNIFSGDTPHDDREPDIDALSERVEESEEKKGAETVAAMRSGAITGILLQPHVTEKSTDLNQRGSYVFRVRLDATKVEIRHAVESLYDVSVASVRTIRVPAKVRRRGRFVGRRPGYKKAIVTLTGGQRIEILPH